MSHKRLWIAAAIIAIVLVAGFALSVPHTSEIALEPTKTEPKNIPSVTLHDSFKKGTHTITGTIEASNACAVIIASASIVGNASSTEKIQVSIFTEEDSGVCLQITTLESFSTTIIAPANLPISAVVNGVEATTTIL